MIVDTSRLLTMCSNVREKISMLSQLDPSTSHDIVSLRACRDDIRRFASEADMGMGQIVTVVKSMTPHASPDPSPDDSPRLSESGEIRITKEIINMMRNVDGLMTCAGVIQFGLADGFVKRDLILCIGQRLGQLSRSK